MKNRRLLFDDIKYLHIYLTTLEQKVLKKKSAVLAFTIEECASAFGPDSNLPGIGSFSKYDGH